MRPACGSVDAVWPTWSVFERMDRVVFHELTLDVQRACTSVRTLLVRVQPVFSHVAEDF